MRGHLPCDSGGFVVNYETCPRPGSSRALTYRDPGVMMFADPNGTESGTRSQQGLHDRVHTRGGALSPEQLWDVHGSALFSLACTLIGDEPAALNAVTWAMVDLYSHSDTVPDMPSGEALREAAECVFRRCHAELADTHEQRTMILPPLMAWLGEITRDQRDALALCVFGGHTYGKAASLLDLPSDVVAGLLTSGLQELTRLAAAGT